jgi:hypothetical protein
MSWDAINTGDFNATDAKKANDAARVKAVNLAKAYHRCFGTHDGKLVLADLTQRFIFQNNTPFGSENPNYEAAYHNGESGLVKFLITQVQKAEVQ